MMMIKKNKMIEKFSKQEKTKIELFQILWLSAFCGYSIGAILKQILH